MFNSDQLLLFIYPCCHNILVSKYISSAVHSGLYHGSRCVLESWSQIQVTISSWKFNLELVKEFKFCGFGDEEILLPMQQQYNFKNSFTPPIFGYFPSKSAFFSNFLATSAFFGDFLAKSVFFAIFRPSRQFLANSGTTSM